MSRPAHSGTINTYHCPKCGCEWRDEWDCGVDDDCPDCGTTCSPVDSEAIAPCDDPECKRDFRAVKLVMSAMPCADSDYHPDWAVIEVTPEFVSRIIWMRTICEKEGLAGVFHTCGPDEWGGGDESTVQGDRLVVEPDRFYFHAHPRGADYDIETSDVNIEAFLAAVANPAGKVPDGWAWHEERLYVTNDASNASLAYLVESFESAGKADSGSS